MTENPIILIPTDAEKEKALLEGRRGPREWRYELWRSNLAGELLESGPFRRIEPLRTVESGAYTINNLRDHTWELTVSMRSDETLDLFSDWVRLFVLLRDDEQPGGWRTYPRGLYKFDFPKGEDSSAATTWDLTGKSPEIVLLDDMPDGGYKVAKSTGVLAAVRTILLGRGVAASRIDLPTTDKLLTADKLYDPLQDVESTRYLRICNDLLATGGFYALWTDDEGRFTTKEIEDTTDTDVAVTYGTTASSDRLLKETIPWETSDERFANRVRVWAGSAQGTIPVQAKAENHDPDSRLSYENYGRWVEGEPVVLENLVSQAVATLVAKAQLRINSSADMKLTLSTFNDPRRQPRDRYGLEINNDSGEPLWRDRWRVNEISHPLDMSGMSHSIYREVRL